LREKITTRTKLSRRRSSDGIVANGGVAIGNGGSNLIDGEHDEDILF
jgi:hypothetical protein